MTWSLLPYLALFLLATIELRPVVAAIREHVASRREERMRIRTWCRDVRALQDAELRRRYGRSPL